MSVIDLTAAAEAAARVHYPRCWEGLSDMQKRTVLDNRLEDLRAALPFIEAAVREKVATEIEVDREATLARCKARGLDVYDQAILTGLRVAADIARTEAPS